MKLYYCCCYFYCGIHGVSSTIVILHHVPYFYYDSVSDDLQNDPFLGFLRGCLPGSDGEEFSQNENIFATERHVSDLKHTFHIYKKHTLPFAYITVFRSVCDLFLPIRISVNSTIRVRSISHLSASYVKAVSFRIKCRSFGIDSVLVQNQSVAIIL